MKLDSKVTGGLAWAGLFVILAVPAADMMSQPSAERAGAATATVDAVETGSVPRVQTAAIKAPTPAVRNAPVENDVVDDYLASGKQLPSYISGGSRPAVTPVEAATVKKPAPPVEAATAAKPAPAVDTAAIKKPATTKPIVAPSTPQTAAVTVDGTFADDEKSVDVAAVPAAPSTPPIPYPASMRPETPVQTASTQPLIIDEDRVADRDFGSPSIEYLEPMAPAPLVTDDELEEWNSGSLADYLERRGLIDDRQPRSEAEYDPDGFYLDEGPEPELRVIGRSNSEVRLIGRTRDGWSLF
jgi:hypothetical protein